MKEIFKFFHPSVKRDRPAFYNGDVCLWSQLLWDGWQHENSHRLSMVRAFTDELKNELKALKGKHALVPYLLEALESEKQALLALFLCTRLPGEDFRRLREVSLYLVDSILRLFEKPTSVKREQQQEQR